MSLLYGPAALLKLLNIRHHSAAEVTDAQAIHPGYGFFPKMQTLQNGLKRVGLLLLAPDQRPLDLWVIKLALKRQ